MSYFRTRSLPVAAFLVLFCFSACTDKGPLVQKSPHTSRLVGNWHLKARITEGGITPAHDRQMKFIVNQDSTFRLEFRGDETQPWIRAGQGLISYEPPELTLYWDSRSPTTILVQEQGSNTLVFHHGRSLAPLKDQEPDEIFEREQK